MRQGLKYMHAGSQCFEKEGTKKTKGSIKRNQKDRIQNTPPPPFAFADPKTPGESRNIEVDMEQGIFGRREDARKMVQEEKLEQSR